MKDRKLIEQNFHSVAGIMLQGWDLGVVVVGGGGGVVVVVGGGGEIKHFSVGICNGASSTMHSSFPLLLYFPEIT